MTRSLYIIFIHFPSHWSCLWSSPFSTSSLFHIPIHLCSSNIPTNPRTFSCLRTFTSFFVQLFFLIHFLFRLQLPHFLSFATSYSQSYTAHHLRPTASIPCSLSSSLLLLFYGHNQCICGPIPAVHKLELLIFLCYLSCNTQHEYIYLIYSGHMLYSRERSTYIPSHTSNHAMSDVRSPVNYFRSGVQFLFKFKVWNTVGEGTGSDKIPSFRDLR